MSDSMQIRRSSLNDFKADDVLLKCSICRMVRTHGIPFHDPEEFKHELEELRDGKRILDFSEGDDDEEVAKRLADLGYIGAADEVR